MNTIYVIANWKEYPETIKEARQIAKTLAKKNNSKKTVAIICPPAPYLESVGTFIKKAKYALGAQDLSPMMIGAYTGEISPRALSSLGVKYAIVGHSERRVMGDDNELILEKLRASLAAGIVPILCVGEKSRADSVKSHAEVAESLAILGELSKQSVGKIIVAYEPLWAIGAKNSATPEDAREMRIYIQKVLLDILGEKVMKSISIVYGGSVTIKNAQDFISISEMNGVLIGRASLDPKSFISIIDLFNQK